MPRRTPRNALDRLRTPRGFHGFLKTAFVCVLMTGLLSPLSRATAAEPAPAQVTVAVDHCGKQCSDILPPGQNGNATLDQIL
ncbi:MAG: hypothetical protein H5T76_05940, partial [Streptomyces sp.]|nr:hypothetical protein [Streptomyces sp.]